MAEMSILVNDKRLDLVEHRGMGGVGISAIGTARRDHADGRLLRQHGADLHGAGMGTQQSARSVGLGLQIEGVVHLARRI